MGSLFLLVTGLAVAASQQVGPPSIDDKAAYARWMVNQHSWGVISTISTQEGFEGVPFGNPVSVGDGGSGSPYMRLTVSVEPPMGVDLGLRRT